MQQNQQVSSSRIQSVKQQYYFVHKFTAIIPSGKDISSSFIPPSLLFATASITLKLHYGNASIHFGFIHFTPNFSIPHCQHPFHRYCSFPHCAILRCPLIFSNTHHYPTAQAKTSTCRRKQARQPPDPSEFLSMKIL
jgi:hypothetical protein